MVNPKKMYACGHCKSLFDDEDEANQCCPAEEVWACGKCEMSWECDKKGAEECCKDGS